MSYRSNSGLDGMDGYHVPYNSTYPATLTKTKVTTTTSGTVATGKKFISMQNIGLADGVFNGITIGPSGTYVMPQLPSGTYTAIAYNATGTKFIITSGV